MSYLSLSPALPHDVQVMIVESAARDGRQYCLKLIVVSRNFAAWVRPILYESVRISGYISIVSFAQRSLFLSPNVNPSLCPTDLSRFSLVKHLFLDTCFDSTFDLNILNACPSLRALAIQGFSLRERSFTMNNGCWSTRQIACRPSHVTLFNTNCAIFQKFRRPAPSILNACTHLSIEHTTIDLSCITYLIGLVPTVTHLALLYSSRRMEAVVHVPAMCAANPRLTLILFLLFARSETKGSRNVRGGAMGRPYGRHRFEEGDPRVAVVEMDSEICEVADQWKEMATRDLDIWKLAEERLRDMRMMSSDFSA
ncbi:hypothetical protein SISNIDRAFT_466721 [Sistotremastrum niveocremeum HHB9708]|uniref:F-box domain-containing protein n=1 Tax=Sistotremastrum niveocremeum HHB9708 TaxID=1314777 RepID=A0A164U2L2_9AGAM|nr:hypothetical protein SISNIDRAFT_466721 [Sistotremastrum niveocremeum HHB9708]